MIRYLLLFLFVVLYAGEPLGLDISIATGLSVKNLFLYLIFIMLAIQEVVTRERKIEALTVFVPFTLLLAYCFFSFLVVVFLVDYPNYSLRHGAVQLKTGLVDNYLVLLVSFYGLAHAKDVVWLMRMVVWLIMLSSLVTLADSLGLPDLAMLELHSSGRVQGFIGQPNGYGVFLGFFFPITIALFLSEVRFKRALAGLGVIATFLCLLLTFSRGAWVGIIFGAAVAAVFLRKYVSGRTVAVTVASAGLAILITLPLLLLTGFGQILGERLSLLSGDAHMVSQGRTTLWLHALTVMTEYPHTFVTGYGWDAYSSFREFRLITHNTYLYYLFNIGAIGLALFVATLLGVLVLLRRALATIPDGDRSFVISVIVGLSALFITMLFTEIFQEGLLIWLYIGLTMRYAIISISEHSATERRAIGHAGAGRVGLAAKGIEC